jgi:hypothetical protein
MRVRKPQITWSLTLPDFQPELRLLQIDANRRNSSFVRGAARLKINLRLRFQGKPQAKSAGKVALWLSELSEESSFSGQSRTSFTEGHQVV